MELSIVVVLVLGFAAYRLTRFLVIDSLIEGVRAKFQAWLFNRQGKLKFFFHKLLDLISCTWCLGFHVSWALYSLFLRVWPWELGVVGWIIVFAIAGVQGQLHAWEPDNE